MSAQRSDAARRAIEGLRRIRAVESAPDQDGIRTVWHQGVRGTELVSWVNAEGRVMRQDFALLHDHLQWSSDLGLRSGESSNVPGSAAGPASGLVRADPVLRRERLLRAASALAAYDGDDSYVLHFKRCVVTTLAGHEALGEEPVTRPWMGSEERTPKQDGDPRRRAAVLMRVAVVLLIAGLSVAAIISK